MYTEIFVSWILQLFAFWFFNFIFFWKTFFYPRHLPTPTNHTHDPRPLPTTHDPRHLATLFSVSPLASVWRDVTTKTSRWQHIVSRNFSIWWKNDRPSRRERTWTKKWKKLPSGKCQFTSLLLFIFQFYKLLLLLLTSKTTFQSKCSSCFRYAVGGDRVWLETRVPSLFPPHFFPRQFFARSPPSECLKQAKA